MFTWDRASVLHLKMVYIPLQVPDDHMRMHAHGFNFWKDKMWNLKLEVKADLRGAEYKINTIWVPGSALNGAPREQGMWVFLNYLLYFFDILSKPCARKKWHTFSGFSPTSLSYKAKAASYPLSSGSRPYSNTQRLHWRGWTIKLKGEKHLQNLLQNSIMPSSDTTSLCLFERARKCLPPSPSAPWTLCTPLPIYPCISEVPQPLLIDWAKK